MIVGGEIIALKNKDSKSLILYPRGTPFLTTLSGKVSAFPRKQSITTSMNLKDEIRRGEAIKVGSDWYRVCCAVGSGKVSEQTQRSTAPTSVTSDKDLSEKNAYFLPFTETALPLDGDFNDSQNYEGVAYKHGCTNDLKEYWKKTVDEYKQFIGNDYALKKELYDKNLISGTMLSQHNANAKKKVAKVSDKKRMKKPRQTVVRANGLGQNAHLQGTEVGRVLQEQREKQYQEALRKHQQQQHQ
jgi:hypothetical protein